MDLFHSTLKAHFGFETFRPGQLQALESLFTHHRLLCIQPTGHGKSLLYQLPSCILPGLTLVISPLLALMRDQVEQLNRRFQIPAGSINSDQTEEENSAVQQAAVKRNLKILFISPEQIDHVDRFEFLLSLPLSLIVIDEAHCVSTWGHDFRPAYRQILHLVKTAEKKYPDLKLLGLTATADNRVEQDIRHQLFSQNNGIVLREKMHRSNLHFSVIKAPSFSAKLLHLEQILQTQKGSGIIYCATREHTELVAEHLQKQKLPVIAYHAGLPSEEKLRLQAAFMRDEFKAIAATNALGMGIDKSNIRVICHFDIPGSITAYYQEVGRAGRDGLPADGILLYHAKDREVQEYFIQSAIPALEDFEKVLSHDGMSLMQLKQATGLHPTRVNVVVAELLEQGYLLKISKKGKQIYQKTEKGGAPDLTHYEILRQTKMHELNAMFEYPTLTSCRMAKLCMHLGDSHPAPCGKCDCCSPKEIFPLAQDKIDRIDRWLFEKPLSIPASVSAGLSEGLSLLDSKLRSPLFCRFMKTRQETTDIDPELWQLLQMHLKFSVSAIVPLPSNTWKARLSVAKAIGDYLKIPVLQLLAWGTPPENRQGSLLNNDQRKLNVHEKMEITDSCPDGPLLLLDDYTGSGATLKEAARTLKKHTKSPLIPLTIVTVKWRLGKSGFI